MVGFPPPGRVFRSFPEAGHDADGQDDHDKSQDDEATMMIHIIPFRLSISVAKVE
jgi:hypothetical protein